MYYDYVTTIGFPGGSVGKNLTASVGDTRDSTPWVEKIPWRREWQLTPIFLLEKFRGERRLVDDNPWDHKESHMTEHERRVFYYHSVQLSSVQFSSSVMTDSW